MKTIRKTKLSFAALALAIVGMGFANSITSAPATASEPVASVAVGEAAPDFTLTDIDGNSHTLSDYTNDGKTVVLMWYSPDCPFVVKHYGDESTFNDIAADFADEDVVLLAINSANSKHKYASPDRNRERIDEWGIDYPVLMDQPGTVGKAYDAKRTPEMFIVGADGNIHYHGAIDNNTSHNTVGTVNYVRNALDEIVAGDDVSTPKTKPYGCTVKY